MFEDHHLRVSHLGQVNTAAVTHLIWSWGHLMKQQINVSKHNINNYQTK